METVKSVMGLGGPSPGKDDEPDRQEPASGVQGAGTVDQPYDAGNLDEQPAQKEPTTPTTTPSHAVNVQQHSTSTQDPQASPDTAAIFTTSTTSVTNPTDTTLANSTTSQQDPPEKINSLFNNPFTKRASISGASKDISLDPKAKPELREEPLPELGLVESAVTIHEPKPVRNPFAPSPRQPDMAPAPRNKGKGKAAAHYYEPIEAQRPSEQLKYERRPPSHADSGSSTSRRSDSNATHTTLSTNATTVGSSAAGGARRASYVPTSQQNPGRIPTAGGRPIGQSSTRYKVVEHVEPGPSTPRALKEQLSSHYFQGAPQFNQQEYLESKRASLAPAKNDTQHTDRGDSATPVPPRRKSSIFERLKGKPKGEDKSPGSGGLFRTLSRKIKK